MPTVYVLHCENDCYYIGQSPREYFIEIDKHFKGEAMSWTRVHKPIRLHLLHHFCDAEDVDLYTIAYMYRYGFDKVRGGRYNECVLSPYQFKEIETLHYNKGNVVCIKCGLFGHTNTKCPFPNNETIINIHPSTTFAIEQPEQHLKSNKNKCTLLKEVASYLYHLLVRIVRKQSRPHNRDTLQPLFYDA